MNNWDKIEYQKISNATIESGIISVRFENGDVVTLQVSSILPVGVTEIDESSLKFNEYEIIVKSKNQDITIPWDTVRIHADIDFAQAMAQKAEENAKLVGDRLRSLRKKKGLKANELAERAQVTPQTITRIEKGHTDVGFGTLRKILASMGYTLRDLAHAELSTDEAKPAISWGFTLKRLSSLGIDTALINKIVPVEIRSSFKNTKELLPDLIQSEVANYFSRIFGWSGNEFWNDTQLAINNDPAQQAFFKTPSKGNITQIRAYSHYAYYLSNVVCRLNTNQPKHEYPADLNEFKSVFYQSYKELNLENLLNYTWDLGIGVIPLNDQGVFHGASWNINGSHVIVLKQRNDSHARWIFDLLHELYHVFAHLDTPNTSVVETEELNPFGNNDTPEELEANAFANQFIFGNRSEEIAKIALDKASYRMDYLRKAVKETAESEKVNAEFIANYLAFRLQMNGQNWWGTANAFQTVDPSPFNLASSILQSKIQLDNLNPIDKNLLTAAIKI